MQQQNTAYIVQKNETEFLRMIEKTLYEKAFEISKNNRAVAARALGVTTTRFLTRAKNLGINLPKGKRGRPVVLNPLAAKTVMEKTTYKSTAKAERKTQTHVKT